MANRLWRSKKGMFLLLMALMVFLTLTFAYMELVKKYGIVEKQFGDLQLGTLKAYAAGERNALSMETAGTQGIDASLVQLGLSGPSMCGKYFGVPLWYQHNDCIPDKAMLKQQFDDALNSFLTKELVTLGLPPTAYDTVIAEQSDATIFAAIPLEPLDIPLHCAMGKDLPADVQSSLGMQAAPPSTGSGASCGTYATKLAFSRTVPYTFTDYALLKDILTKQDGLIPTLQVCAQNLTVEACTQQHLEGFDTTELDFTAGCDKGPEGAFYAFLEAFTDCASSLDTGCRCSAFSASVIDRIREMLGKEYQIRLEGDKHTASLTYLPSHEVLLTAPLPKASLCIFESAYGNYLGASTDVDAITNRNVYQADLEFREGPLGPASLQVAVDNRMFQTIEHPYFPIYKKGNFLCFVPAGKFGVNDYAAVPACTIPEKKVVKLCATSRRYALPYYDPITKKFAMTPLVYRFAVDMG